MLESPHFFVIREPQTGSLFQIEANLVGKLEKPEFTILPDGETWYLACLSGFETDAEHLSYLISLGNIPLSENYGGSPVNMGYVIFEEEKAAPT